MWSSVVGCSVVASSLVGRVGVVALVPAPRHPPHVVVQCAASRVLSSGVYPLVLGPTH